MNETDIQGTRAIVIGAGVSGRAAALFMLDLGARVDMLDDLAFDSLPEEAQRIKAFGVDFLAGIEGLNPSVYDLALVSPGVPLTAAPVKMLSGAGVPVIGEIELAARYLAAPIAAVTGTNGKSTATELLGSILSAWGCDVFTGGNLGRPLIEAAGKRWDAAVVEVSSYQLETIDKFRPKVSILLNITDDHLERHGDMSGYAAAKAKIFANQGDGDLTVINADDPLTVAVSEAAGCEKIYFSTLKTLSEGAWIDGGEAVFRLPGSPESRFPLSGLRLRGAHNVANVLAACLAASRFGVETTAAWRAACEFSGLPHRLEYFLERCGVSYVDDSKATNVDAAIKALEAVSPPVVWIGGGVDKGGSYEPLGLSLANRARLAVLAGPASSLIASALAGKVETFVASDWDAAFRHAVSAARQGDCVLLAPACSSFDSFSGYAERGVAFQQACFDETKRLANDC